MGVSRTGWSLSGVEPSDDPAWAFLGPAARRAFWSAVATIAAAEWDDQVASGIGATGRKLRPISARTRAARAHPHYSPMGKADPDAPPLTPCYGASRTRSLLRHVVRENEVYFYWDVDSHTGGSWGKILAYHRDGLVRGAPVRNVFGLSAARKLRVQARARAWYLANREGLIRRTRGLAPPAAPPVRNTRAPRRVEGIPVRKAGPVPTKLPRLTLADLAKGKPQPRRFVLDVPEKR